LSIFLFKWFFKFEVEGKELFPKNTPFILASNHLSNLDPVVLGAACPHKLNFLAKEELFRNKLFAFILRRVGAIPLKRGQTDVKMMRIALRILQEKPLVVFPQGTRGANYDNFKAGVGFLYKKTHLPIVAAKIYGTDKVLPREAKFVRRGEIKVIFDKVVGIDNNESYQDTALKVINKIKNL
jgi:1-acyl-sn-glycerol-3-phosphate acyltransferase